MEDNKKYCVHTYYTTGPEKGNRKATFFCDTLEQARQIRTEHGTGERFNMLNPTIFKYRYDSVFNTYDYFYMEG